MRIDKKRRKTVTSDAPVGDQGLLPIPSLRQPASMLSLDALLSHESLPDDGWNLKMEEIANNVTPSAPISTPSPPKPRQAVPPEVTIQPNLQKAQDDHLQSLKERFQRLKSQDEARKSKPT